MTNQFAQDSAALYHLFLVAFNASPGSKYWAQLQALDASGLSGVQVIDAMIKDPNLSKAFPADQSNAAFAQQIGNDLIGELASESAKATAIQLIENALEQTLTRPQVLDALAQYLGTLPTKPTQNGFDPSNPYLRVAQSLQKKTVVAQYFTEVMPFQGDDLAKLRDSVSRINDQSDVSSIAGIERLIRGFDQSREYDSYQTFVLAFSAAPGNRLLGLIRDEVSNGLSDAEIIDKLLLDPVTSKLYGTNDSSAVFATKLVSQFMRESDPLQLKAGAIDLISQVLQAGWTRGMVIEALAKYLRDIPASPDETGYQANDPLTKIALRLDNKALGAKIYTDFLGADASDITTLRAVLDRIDEQSDLSTPQTIRALMAQSETGRLQDGYIQGATVFADTDNDGVLDPGEQSTVTDAQGNFKLEGAIGNLVAFGGVDIATQLPFSSVYRAPLGSTIINPLTTLVSSLTDTGQTPDAAQALVAKQLGLPASLKLGRYDPLAILADSSSSTGQRSDAADVFKASAMVANAIVQATGAVGSISAADDSDVSKAAAKVLSGFFDGTEKLVDLAQTETLTKLLINTASAMGDAAKLTGVAAELAQVMQASNREIQKVTSNNASAGAIAESIIKAQKVAQGQATNEIEKAVSSGSSTALVANYTGAALVDRIRDTEIGTIGNGLVGTRSNLAPLASNLSSAETYTEDTALNLIDIVVADTDSANITATLTLSSAAAGSLSVASSGSVTSSFNSATGVWSASGALASVNALLAGLVFTPAANANGNFSITTSISDGVNSPITGTKSFTGTAVNDAPVLDASQSPSLGSVAQSAATPSGAVGVLVSSLLSGVSDPDAGAQRGLAITATQSTGGTLYYSLNNGVAWSSVGAVNESAALLLPADTNTRLYYQPNAGASLGTIDNTLSFRAWDQSAPASGAGTKANLSVTGGTSAYSSATDTVSVTVVGAPRLNAAFDVTKPLDPSTNLVLSVGESVTAVAGKFITITDRGGVAGSTGYRGENAEHSFSIAATDPRVKIQGTGANTKIVIDPDVLFDLDLSSQYTLAVEAGAFLGGSGLPSSALAGVSFSTVTPYTGTNIVEAPVSYVMDPVLGTLMAGKKWVDIEERGLGITGTYTNASILDASQGDFVFSFRDASSAGGNDDTGVSGINTTTDLNVLLKKFGAGDRIYIDDQFNDSTMLNLPGVSAFTAGTGGTTGSTALRWTIFKSGGAPKIWVELENGPAQESSLVAVNSALGLSGSKYESAIVGDGFSGSPVESNLAPTASNLSSAEAYTEDTALNLIDIVVSDTDSTNITATLTLSSAAAGSLSVASSGSVTSSFNSATGVWSASGALASVNALLAGLVFTPAANANGNFSMTTSISDGVNSPITGSKLFTGTAVNDAPVLDASQSPSLGSVAQSAATPSGAVGVLVSSLLSGVSDPDAGAQRGLAITATQSTGGTLYYSLNNGVAWSSVGAVNESAALLLPADNNTRLYYQPHAGASLGTINNALSFRAWDQSAPASGAGTKANLSVTGGASPFSSVTDTASVAIISSTPAASVQFETSLAKAGLLLKLKIPSALTSVPISAYDFDISTPEGTFAVAYTKGALASLSRAESTLSVAPVKGDSWRVSGIDSTLNNPFTTNNDYIVSVVLDRITNTALQINAKVTAYDENLQLIVGSSQNGSADVLPYSIQQNINLAVPSQLKTNGLSIVLGTSNSETIEGGPSSDLLLSLGGNDQLTPGKGADGVILSEGVKTIIYRQGDSGSFNSNLLRLGESSNSLSLSTTTFDVISGLALVEPQSNSRVDFIDLPDGNYRKVAPPATPKLDGSIEALLSDTSYMQLLGNYDPIQDMFTFTNTGKSSILIIDFGQQTEAIVLVGFTGSVGDDDLTGRLSFEPSI